MEEEYKKENEIEKKLRTEAYLKAIEKKGIPQKYIDSGNPQGCVLEDIAHIINPTEKSEEEREKLRQESYERWCRKWSEP
jgi:hypothetical protein